MIPTKICGITNLVDAKVAVNNGASAIGFIFYEKSPRAISIENAKSISKQLSNSIGRVGVFVNQNKEVFHVRNNYSVGHLIHFEIIHLVLRLCNNSQVLPKQG